MGEVDRIDDLVVLGRAAPEPIDDGRHTVCLGGYSETVGYVRLYPTQKWMDELQRWNVVSVPVEDAHPDTRDESYKIAGSKAEWDTLHTKIEQVDQLTKTEQIQLVDELATDCANALRDEERSLGIVKPAAIHDFELDPRPDPTYQMTLDRERQVGKTQYPYRLYIEYTCEGCQAKGHHRQHCIEWGVYMYWDNNEDDEGVVDALRLTDDRYSHYFFIGNMQHQPTSYIIISDLRFSESDMLNAGVNSDRQPALDQW